MKTKILTLTILSIAGLLAFNGCNKNIDGCTDSTATNYDPDATNDNGSCLYVWGCTDPTAINYDASATKDDGSCIFYVPPKEGKIIFYLKLYPFSYYGSGVDVWLNWQTQNSYYLGKITNIPQNPPNCGSWWGLNYSDTTYSYYTYHAVLDGSPTRIWDGSFNLKPDTCIKVELSNE